MRPMNSRAWWPSRCSHASGDNPHTICTNLTLDCTNITLDRIDAMSTTTVLVRENNATRAVRTSLLDALTNP